MNLGAIVNAVGQRITMVQPRDLAAAMTFATLRHDQLYRQFLWKDSIILLNVDIDVSAGDYVPTNYYMPTKGNMVLPPIFQSVIAVRTSHHYTTNIERPMVYFRVPIDEFKRTGSPSEYFLLPSAVWEFDVVENVTISHPNVADSPQTAIFDVQDADLISVDRLQIGLGAIAPATVVVANTDVVYGMQKTVTQGTLQMLAGGTVIKTMQPTDTDVPKCQRFRFMNIPDRNTTVRVLGKRTTPPFSVNSDVPGINGLDGIIYALVYYDMCHRDERGGTPEADKALIEAVGPEFLISGKAGGFLGKLIEEEVVQAAHNTRILPEFGFGDDEDDFFRFNKNTSDTTNCP